MPKGVYIRTEENKKNISLSKIGSIPWNKGLKCGPLSKETKLKLSRIHIGNTYNLGRKLSAEERRILSTKHKRGKEHHSWKGGKKRARSADLEYRLWRVNVFERDNYTCQHCSLHGVYLEPHHIQSWAFFPELRYELSNGLTLCRDCHKLTDNYKGSNKNVSFLQ